MYTQKNKHSFLSAGSACAKLLLTTDVTNETHGMLDDAANDIYCPMPFQPESYYSCCLNAADQWRCCQTNDASTAHRLTYD